MMEVHIDRKQYWIIFFVLGALTALEIGVVYMPISWGLMVSALVGLAVVKAATVGIFYMHLGHETMVLKMTVMVPMCVPGFYAFVLILDSAARLLF